jgi:CRP/FNR family transcriptional regulator, cyclic AMP receptor protein
MKPIDPHELRQASIFSTLSDEELNALAAQVELEHYSTGDMIFFRDDPGDAMYVVQEGTVDLVVKDTAGFEVSLLRVAAGQVFGELSFLDGKPRSASARALTEVQVLVIRRDALVSLTQRKPAVALQMLEILAARLRSSSLLVQGRVVPNANEAIEVKLTLGDRLSDFFTDMSGNIKFVAVSLIWFVVWIVWNMEVLPGVKPFDPFPFGLLTMIVSLEMVFLSLFILIKQARLAANDKIRNDIEYEVNVRAELGIQNVSRSIETLEQLLQNRIDRLEKRLVAGDTAAPLAENGNGQTRPDTSLTPIQALPSDWKLRDSET